MPSIMERVRLAAPKRDILTDLKERLRDAVAERDEHLNRATELDKIVAALTLLIDTEQKPAATKQSEPTEELAVFIFRALLGRPQTKEDLKNAAVNAGYDVDGRSIHAVTVNLARTGKIKELHHGVYGVDAEGAAA